MMPVYYRRTLSKHEDFFGAVTDPQSNTIVINLHTNVFNSGISEESKFVDVYNDFIGKI